MEATIRADTVREDARSRLTTAMEKAKDLCDRLEQQTRAAAKVTDKAVREHPYQAIGIAFGIGVLMGVLAARYGRN